jgi:hypothetical protein
MTLHKLLKIIIKENIYHEDKDRLYHREKLIKKLLSKDKQGRFIAPKNIRDYINKLPYIECNDSNGNIQTCTKIPEFLYVYLYGRY